MKYMGQVASEQLVQGFGLPAAIVIAALIAVIIFISKLYLDEVKLNRELLERQITDAKETRDKINEPLAAQAELSGKMYDLLVKALSERGN